MSRLLKIKFIHIQNLKLLEQGFRMGTSSLGLKVIALTSVFGNTFQIGLVGASPYLKPLYKMWLDQRLIFNKKIIYASRENCIKYLKLRM